MVRAQRPGLCDLCAGVQPPPQPAALRGLQGAAPPSAAAAGRPAGVPPARVKLVLLGDSGVGKSCLVLRYVRNQFDPASKITVGAAFLSHNVSLPEGQTIKFEIWDTAGQERYLSLAPLYYRGAHAAAIVYDISNAGGQQQAAPVLIRCLAAAVYASLPVDCVLGNMCHMHSHMPQGTVAAESQPTVTPSVLAGPHNIAGCRYHC